MLELINKIKENKVLRIIGNILYYMLFIIIILILLVVIIQRVSNNTLSLGGYRIFNIVSASMMPDYEIGDILISKEISPSNVEIGDDIVYIGKKIPLQGMTVTHRVIEKKEENGEYTFRTKGIANEESDPTITGNQIYGKVIYKVQTLSFISKIINNLYAFYFFIFVPLSIIIIKKITDIVYYLKHKDEDDNEEEQKEIKVKEESNNENK